ncbi:MAG: IS4 family transposase [Candidatus Competibacteraceae bacterium]
MSQWAEEEFGAAQLGDQRRTRRLVAIATARAQRPSVSLPQSFDGKAGLKAMYQFCDSEHVRRDAILESHYQATARRVASEQIVLAVQDTTYVDYSHHPATHGVGILTDEQQHGLLLHRTLLVTPNRVPLGLIDQPIIYRDPAEFGKKHRRKQRPIEEKESRKWLDSLRATARLQAACPDTRLINVGDREADGYDGFVLSRKLQQDVLVRAAWNRAVDHEERYRWDVLEAAPVAGTVTVTVPRHGTQPGRTATLTVQFTAVTLKPPRHRAQEPLPRLPVDGVLARESAPPAGVKPIEWLLLTTVPVITFADACERIQWYSCRWIIEIYHKILKSGCRIETRQLETAARLERYLAIDSVVAWRVLGLTFQSRDTPEMRCEAFLDRDDWQALACYRNHSLTPPQQPPTLKQAARWIAQLGGFLGRKGDGDPGVTVMWHGLQRLYDLVAIWRLFNHSNDMVN